MRRTALTPALPVCAMASAVSSRAGVRTSVRRRSWGDLALGLSCFHVDGEPPIGSRAVPLTSLAPGGLRYYWSPSTRNIVYACGLGVPLVTVSVLFTEGLPFWLTVPVGVALVATFPPLVWRTRAPGVRETSTELQWRAGRRTDIFRRGQAAWQEIRYFEYCVSSFHRDDIAIVLTDGTRKKMRGARRTMHWSEGETDDFVATLTERARVFGASIEPRPPRRSDLLSGPA